MSGDFTKIKNKFIKNNKFLLRNNLNKLKLSWDNQKVYDDSFMFKGLSG